MVRGVLEVLPTKGAAASLREVALSYRPTEREPREVLAAYAGLPKDKRELVVSLGDVRDEVQALYGLTEAVELVNADLEDQLKRERRSGLERQIETLQAAKKLAEERNALAQRCAQLESLAEEREAEMAALEDEVEASKADVVAARAELKSTKAEVEGERRAKTEALGKYRLARECMAAERRLTEAREADIVALQARHLA